MKSYTWPDGTPKSQGNAFDWRNQSGMFTKPMTMPEKVSMTLAATRMKPGKAFSIVGTPRPKGVDSRGTK
jgi:hypothetical protein